MRDSTILKFNNKIANNNGVHVSGDLLSEKSIVSVSCEEGHMWDTKASNILTGRWCPVCAKKLQGKKAGERHHIEKIKRQIDYIRSGQAYFDMLNKEIKRLQNNQSRRIRSVEKRIEYNLNRREHERDRQRSRYWKDTAHRTDQRIKTHINKVLRDLKPIGRYGDMLGYTGQELKDHMESLFTDGMSWDNIGEWTVDHIKPKCSFNFYDEYGEYKHTAMVECWSLSNLQPLWAIDNYKKGRSV